MGESNNVLNLKIDPERLKLLPEHATNVQLQVPDQDGNTVTVDIIVLDKASLTAWLRTGGDNRLAENLIGMFMGHGPLRT